MTPHRIGPLEGLHYAVVRDTADPEGRGRIHVELVPVGVEVWAPVVTLSAGGGYGIACLPRVDELVVVGFVGPDQPLVLGGVWHGAATPPDEADPPEEHYLLRTPAGCVVRLDDGDGPKVTVETPAGHGVELDDGAGEVRVRTAAGDEMKLAADGITITASAKVTVNAGAVEISAGMLTVNAGMSKFSGVVQADTLVTNSVVSSSYTPGAGNIW